MTKKRDREESQSKEYGSSQIDTQGLKGRYYRKIFKSHSFLEAPVVFKTVLFYFQINNYI